MDADLIPCHWITPTLCSHCYDEIPAWKPGMKVYEGIKYDDSVSVIIRRLVMGEDNGARRIDVDLSEALVRRPELVTDVPGLAVEIAASILSDCYRDDALAIELAALYALDVIRPLLDESLWVVNEFQVRLWTSENKVPY